MNGMAALNDLRRRTTAAKCQMHVRHCDDGDDDEYAHKGGRRTDASIVDSEAFLACFPDDDLGVIAKNGEEGSLVRAAAAAATTVLAASHDDCEIFI